MSETLTIGIVTHNSAAYLPSCLKSVFAQTHLPHEVLIWDNASQDGTAALLHDTSYAMKVTLSDDNVGFARAHNALIAAAAGDFYLALNPDLVLEADYAAYLIAALQADDRIGWASGTLFKLRPDGRKTTSLVSTGHALRKSGYAIHLTNTDQQEVFGVSAAAAMYRREMLDVLQQATGDAFDETFFLYYEDVDLDWRARLLGWRCRHVPEARAYHAVDGSYGRSVPTLSVQAQGYRILSIIKNAFLIDLIVYNLPRILVRLLLEMIVHPRSGYLIIKTVLKGLGPTLRKRHQIVRARQVSYREMQRWFSAARQADSGSSGRRVLSAIGLTQGHSDNQHR